MRSLRAMVLTWSFCVSPLLATNIADAQPASASKPAAQRFADAQALYEKGSYEQAYSEFEALVRETGSPNAELYLGRCLREMGRLPEAYEATRRALDNALTKAEKEEKYQQTRSAAAADLAKLELRVGKIIVAVANPPENLTITVNGKPLPREKLGAPTAVNVGESIVVLEAPDKKRIERRLTLEGGKTETITVALESTIANTSKEQDKPPQVEMTGGSGRTVGYVILGLGAAGIVTFGAAGSLANQRYDKIYAACGGTHCTDSSFGPSIEEGRQFDLIANIGLGVGAVGIVTGTLLVVFGGPKPKQPVVSGFVVPGAGGLSVSGTF